MPNGFYRNHKSLKCWLGQARVSLLINLETGSPFCYT